MSLVDIVRSKDLYDFISELIMQSDGTYRKHCDLHGGYGVERFDVYTTSVSDCEKFGRQYKEVVIRR